MNPSITDRDEAWQNLTVLAEDKGNIVHHLPASTNNTPNNQTEIDCAEWIRKVSPLWDFLALSHLLVFLNVLHLISVDRFIRSSSCSTHT